MSKTRDATSKITKAKTAGGMTLAAECLHTKHQTLSSNTPVGWSGGVMGAGASFSTKFEDQKPQPYLIILLWASQDSLSVRENTSFIYSIACTNLQ
jgi:hypothetical protein